MTEFMWRGLIWATAILALSAHVFLHIDANNINTLKDRVEELEAAK